MGAGYSPTWIADACGLRPRSIITALTERNGGHVRRMGAVTTARVLAADIETGTAGRGPALAARRQLQALACHGYAASRLQGASGISFVTLAAIRRGATQTITAAHHHAIAGMYGELCGTFGDSTEARRRALALGWAPPFAWDDITDPNALPDLGEPTRRRAAPHQRFTLEDLDFLLEGDPMTLDQMASRLHVDPSAIEHACARGERRDILARMARNKAVREYAA